jgi:hypothetical protein
MSFLGIILAHVHLHQETNERFEYMYQLQNVQESAYNRRLESVVGLPVSLPLGLKNQTAEEREYLKLHKCRDTGEAYSASYLITKEHIANQFTAYNLTWVNCEMGSFIMMNGRADPKRNVNGSITQSLDVLDFSVSLLLE